jgi:hypothetical protein
MGQNLLTLYFHSWGNYHPLTSYFGVYQLINHPSQIFVETQVACHNVVSVMMAISIK